MQIRKWIIAATLVCISQSMVPASRVSNACAKESAAIVTIRPEEYPKALRNPLKGFRADYPQSFTTLNKNYIRWSDLENKASDGVDKIRRYCDELWKDYPKHNMKAIPRVWLYMPNDKGKYAWPADMQLDDYSSPAFKERVVRFVKKLGEAWDDDPRVAYVEMGIIGHWGEQHNPDVSPEMQKILGEAFTAAFKNKLVMVRNPRDFRNYTFGIFWDSWAHYSQTDSIDSGGKGIEALGDRWKTAVIGGEVAYDWGNYRIQPGDGPNDTLSDPDHREFLLDTIRKYHCNHLGWVADYDTGNPAASKGAEEVQKALGYRFVIGEVQYPAVLRPAKEFEVSFSVRNIGSSPFYYNWPVEITLLDPVTRKSAWKATFEDLDIRRWLPGDKWMTLSESLDIRHGTKDDAGKLSDLGTIAEHKGYAVAPKNYEVKGKFRLPAEFKNGEYILSLAILDPAGMLPSARFAVRNYFTGGRHPIGLVGVGKPVGKAELDPRIFDDVQNDITLHYVVEKSK